MTFLTRPQAIEITSNHASWDFGTSHDHETRLARVYWSTVEDIFPRIVKLELPDIHIDRIRLVPK